MRRRKRVAPARSTRFQKLRALKCFGTVYERLCGGWGLKDLARYIQEEEGEYTEISLAGLAQQLGEFRKTLPAGHLVQKRFPKVFEEAKAEVAKGVDEIKEMEELYRIQRGRIEIDTATEREMGKLLPSVNMEIREARQLLETLAQLKNDTGLGQQVAPSVDVSVAIEANLGEALSEQFGNPAVREVLEDPESRRRVSGLVERFLKLPEPPALLPAKQN